MRFVCRERRRELGEKAQKLHAAGVVLQQQQQQLTAGEANGSSSPGGSKLFSSIRGIRKEQQQVQQERRFKLAVYVLEQEYRQLVVAIKERGENPFYSFLKLIGGLVFGLMSLLWMMHIFLFFILSQILGQEEPEGLLRFLDWFFQVRMHITNWLASWLATQPVLSMLLGLFSC